MMKMFSKDPEKEEKGENIEEQNAFLRKWSPKMIIGAFFPAIFCMIIVFFGNIVLNTAALNCTHPLTVDEYT